MSDLWKGEDFKIKQELEKITKSKINNFDYIKLRSFCTNKNNETKITRKQQIGKQYGSLDLDQHLIPYTKINSEWVNDLNMKKETISKLGEHRIVYLSDLWKREDLKIKQELEKITKSKINNFDYIKLKRFCTNKTNATKFFIYLFVCLFILFRMPPVT